MIPNRAFVFQGFERVSFRGRNLWCGLCDETEYQVFTYSIINGEGVFKGEGDQHDPKYDEFGGSMVLLNCFLEPDPSHRRLLRVQNDFLSQRKRISVPGWRM